MKILSIILHLFTIAILTITTQIGGIIWCISLFLRWKYKDSINGKSLLLIFFLLYLSSTFFILPPLAHQFGRVPLPISKSSNLAPHTYMTAILNRHYVTPNLKNELLDIANQFEKANPGIKTVYLDANFPFWDGFPLLPHLSHNDGKKIDLSFQYSKKGILVNNKPSNTGYGHYEIPKNTEVNQPQICNNEGFWQYDFPQYLTLGSDKNISFNALKTKELLNIILNRRQTQKVFIEPHLKSRMKISHEKLRYQGCHSVRHDDHVHFQIY